MESGDHIGAAYDAVAADYDRQLEPALWIRRILWRHFDRLFHPGDKVLDVGCGTGSDAIHLARSHVRVIAIDSSAQMLARLQSRLATEPLPLTVEVRHGNVDQLAQELTGPFDGIISSFAALNTVNLQAFAPQAARLLRPGGHLICHMLSAGHRQSWSSRLFGRRSRASASALQIIEVGGERLSHLNLEPDHVSRLFDADFVLRTRYALGLFVTGTTEAWLPGTLLDAIGRIEPVVGALPGLVSRGRFYVLDLERR